MELQPNESTLKIELHCQKRDCPHQNCAPDEWASLKLFWCTNCKRIWCETCWDNVDAHEMIEERATGLLHGMEDHNKGKLALQDDQLQQLLVEHQSERRSMLLRQHHQLATHRLALLINHERKPKKRPIEFSKEEQDCYHAQLMLLEQQNNQRFLNARQEQENR